METAVAGCQRLRREEHLVLIFPVSQGMVCHGSKSQPAAGEHSLPSTDDSSQAPQSRVAQSCTKWSKGIPLKFYSWKYHEDILECSLSI